MEKNWDQVLMGTVGALGTAAASRIGINQDEQIRRAGSDSVRMEMQQATIRYLTWGAAGVFALLVIVTLFRSK